MAKRLRIALIGFVVLVLAAAGATSWAWQQLDAPLELPADGLLFEVPSGAALSQVTARLAGQGILSYPRLLDWYARATGAATGIHAGEYQLLPGLTGRSLLEKLGRGDVYLHQFTIIEGWRFADLLANLREHPAIAAGSDASDAIMAALGKPGLHPEGQFLPDTYSFPRGIAEIELLALAHEALETELEDAWYQRDGADLLEDAYAGLVLASIIEKETALDDERRLISGVMHARLARGMRLQTDPTVIYGVGDDFDGDLTRAHLTTDTPYNTYTRAGLPPTPIALPGRASIRAAFTPVDSGALYFVATGEPDGSHAFSATLEEHNAAVQRYLARQRAGD